MQLDTASTFTKFNLSEEETRMACQVSPLFLAYLQNKIEAYATGLVDAELPFDPDPNQQVKAILAHEKLKNFVQAYQELLFELISAQQTSDQT
jgi:hypothetical protein